MESSARENFYIEKITGIAIDKDNTRYYKIQWAASWEKEENLIGCSELIQQFLSEQADKINSDLQQPTATKQEEVIQSVHNVIHQTEPNNISSTNDVKEEVTSSVSDEDLSQRLEDNSSIQFSTSRCDANEVNSTTDAENVNWFDSINSPNANSNMPTKVESPFSQSVSKSQKRFLEPDQPQKNKTEVSKSKAKMSSCRNSSSSTFPQTNIRSLFQKETAKNIHNYGFVKCFTCNGTFSTLNDLQMHKKNDGCSAQCSSNNAKQEWNYSSQRETSPKISRNFKCAACIKSFKSSPLLKKHIKTHRDPYTCRHCGEKFIRYHSLNLHVMNIHTDEDGGLLKKKVE